VLFNSFEFIFVFLPITLVGFFLLGAFSRSWALFWIILVSLFFYGWWRPLNLLIIAPSIVINFALARLLERISEKKGARNASKLVLLLGIAFNVAFLGYFKYVDFVSSTANDIFGTNLILRHIILPLGISFITFQKIAFLIDVHAGRVESFKLRDYCLFVLFFPQLIAGPIVHYREMMPQFHSLSCRLNNENISVGLTLFMFGLFKKVFLADHIAPLVTPIYEQASKDGGTSLLLAWMAAIGFTLQLYFDFSGYTDMALGIARFIGIRLPPNFNSPLQASSIIDFWLRWHITLTRFLTAYIYNPLSLWLTRRRMARGRPGVAGRSTTVGAFCYVLMFPTLLTMLLSGLWHGAGYGFVVWGLLHGILLTINHAWRLLVSKMSWNRGGYERLMKRLGWFLTFLSVAATMVFFRSTTMTAASDLVKGMIGLNGIALPGAVYEHAGPIAVWLHRAGVGSVPREILNSHEFVMAVAWITLMMFIALACPNTLQILARYEPALGVKPHLFNRAGLKAAEWSTSVAWTIGISAITVISILSLGSKSEFLYWQF
jgi:alginate O-acetyltransferase complex protein AlgI